MERLTIFTPTYNRAYILPKLYESLCEQTCKDFDWLIVDDGSTDYTKELVEEWLNEKKIAVRYVYQDNSGKMMAHNRAVKETQAELFMCVDSDDHLCSAQVVGDVISFWDNHSKILHNNICGIVAFKEMGKKRMAFPEGMNIAHLSGLEEKGFNGEVALIFRRDVLEQYPFPSFVGEKFVTDVYIYDQIDQKYMFMLFSYYVQHCEYHEDGYSHNYMKLLFNNPKGFRAYHNQCVSFRKKGYLKSVICYVALSLRIGDWKMILHASDKTLTILLFPLGILKYIYDNYRLSKL